MVGEFFGIANWLNVQVVYEASFANEGGEESVSGARDPENGLEGVDIHDFRVINRGERLCGNYFAHGGLELQRVAHACGELGAGGLERAMQDGGGGALVFGEICVAGGESEAVWLADNWAYDNFRVEIQVARHLRNDAHLLRVFAAEISVMGLDDFEQFHDDGGYAAKVAGARAAFEAIA